MYDPAIGRWMEEDPEGFAAGDSNLYRYVNNRPTVKTDPSGLREADDRLTARTNSLVDVSQILENYVNRVIQQSWREAQDARQNAGGFARRVYDQLGADQPGSEVSTPIGKKSPIAKIGVWLDTNLNVAQNQIVKLTFAQSRYRDNKLQGVWAALGIPWLYNQATADHGIAPTIKIKNTLMGTDKWEHFFQQGYWGFDAGLSRQDAHAYGLWLEGDRSARGHFFEAHPDIQRRMANQTPWVRHDFVDQYYQKISAKFGVTSWYGIYGNYSTGIVSHADINANIAGQAFYEKLFNAYQLGQTSYPFSFSVNDYPIQRFNEQNVPNTFSPNLIVNDNEGGMGLPPPARLPVELGGAPP
jgi:hypothetical protein